MNIIENGAIDWSMFGMALRSFRRDKGLTEEQFADLMNNNGEIIDEKTVKKIEAGKATPNVYQLSALDRLTGSPNRTIKAVSDLADYLINGTTDKGESDSDDSMWETACETFEFSQRTGIEARSGLEPTCLG